MSIVRISQPVSAPGEELHNGDRMSRQEFHRLYEKTPDGFKAELIGGVVFLGSRVNIPHGTTRALVSAVLFAYQAATAGVEVATGATVLLGDESEPQPDLLLRILPEFGGQSRTGEDDYLEGPPELVAEIAYGSGAIDLNAKLEDYRRYGVPEYLVVNLAGRRVHWFDLRRGEERAAGADGIIRVRNFPGLWIDAEALLAEEINRLVATLHQGLASPEHAEFVAQLTAAWKAKGQGTP